MTNELNLRLKCVAVLGRDLVDAEVISRHVRIHREVWVCTVIQSVWGPARYSSSWAWLDSSLVSSMVCTARMGSLRVRRNSNSKSSRSACTHTYKYQSDHQMKDICPNIANAQYACMHACIQPSLCVDSSERVRSTVRAAEGCYENTVDSGL